MLHDSCHDFPEDFEAIKHPPIFPAKATRIIRSKSKTECISKSKLIGVRNPVTKKNNGKTKKEERKESSETEYG